MSSVNYCVYNISRMNGTVMSINKCPRGDRTRLRLILKQEPLLEQYKTTTLDRAEILLAISYILE